MYQPTIFIPLAIIDNINAVINLIETAIKTLANQESVNPSLKPVMSHNLDKLQNLSRHDKQL